MSHNNLFSPAKTITLELIGQNSNAFSLMGAFERQAKRENWSNENIAMVINEAKSGDYDNLLATLVAHCESSSEDDDWEDDEDYYDDDEEE